MKRLAILLVLLATTTQAFVAQTHVHAGFAAQATAATGAGDERLPFGGEDSSCLLCQIAAHGAAALTSHDFIVLSATQQYVVAALPDTPDPQSLPLTHAWSSRGPPRS